LPILDGVYSSFTDIQASRFGLRYIDQVLLDPKPREEWEGIIKKDLLTIFDIVRSEMGNVSRGFSILELNYGDSILRFQFGIPNADFPAPIKKNLFILDYDAYYQGLIEKDEILPKLETFHDRIKKMYKDSIIY